MFIESLLGTGLKGADVFWREAKRGGSHLVGGVAGPCSFLRASAPARFCVAFPDESLPAVGDGAADGFLCLISAVAFAFRQGVAGGAWRPAFLRVQPCQFTAVVTPLGPGRLERSGVQAAGQRFSIRCSEVVFDLLPFSRLSAALTRGRRYEIGRASCRERV